ncbi:hypothetical protein BC828DRAFT_396946 [Blastocladiella britannica]|nr:hypothetical protein BC828DRAFT_396946 [Blastocladiella britannica]
MQPPSLIEHSGHWLITPPPAIALALAAIATRTITPETTRGIVVLTPAESTALTPDALAEYRRVLVALIPDLVCAVTAVAAKGSALALTVIAPAITVARHRAGLATTRSLLVPLGPGAALYENGNGAVADLTAALYGDSAWQRDTIRTLAAVVPLGIPAACRTAVVPRLLTAISALPTLVLSDTSVLVARAALEFSAGNYDACLEACLAIPSPLPPPIFARIADAHMKLGHLRAAVFWHWTAIATCESVDVPLVAYACKMLGRLLLDHQITISVWEILADDAASDAWIAPAIKVLTQHRQLFQARYPIALRRILAAADWIAPTMHGARYQVRRLDSPPAQVALPRFFSWLIPGVLCGMSEPCSAADVVLVRELGVGLVVTTTLEKQLPDVWFPEANSRVVLPVADQEPPTVAQADAFIRLVVLAYHRNNKACGTLVHCAGGKGRTGSFLSAYLIRFGFRAPPPLCEECASKTSIAIETARAAAHFNDGFPELEAECTSGSVCAMRAIPALSASQAMADVRSYRPGSIESTAQELFIQRYSDACWKRIQQQPSAKSWDADLPATPTMAGPSHFHLGHLPRVVLLMGLPGSGKSHFSRALQAQLPAARFVIVDSDNPGDFLSAVGAYCKTADMRIILDACHATAAYRLATLAAAFDPAPHEVLGVHFAAPADVCVRRAENRTNHPTLPAERAARAVAGFARQMQPPRFSVPPTSRAGRLAKVVAAAEEGDAESKHYGTWATVHTYNQAQALLAQLTRTDALMTKFPRTAHLYPGARSITDDDIVISDLAHFQHAQSSNDDELWTVEEKIDGANVGIHAIPLSPLDPDNPDECTIVLLAQNRSHFVACTPSISGAESIGGSAAVTHPQFSALPAWLERHRRTLVRLLLMSGEKNADGSPSRRILFGEWAAAKHSVHYSALPDRFIAFDLFDTGTRRYLSRGSMRAALERAACDDEAPVHAVRTVWSGKVWPAEHLNTIQDADAWVRSMGSVYGAAVPEGIVVRLDRGPSLVHRAKYVREDFIAGNDHWSKSEFVANSVVVAHRE